MSEKETKIKLVRISTVPHSLDLLLKGQMRYMSSQGFEVVMMCSQGPEVIALQEREGCEWMEVPLTRSFSVLDDLKALFYLIKLFRLIKPDVVHSHSPKAGTVGQMAAWICRVPLRIHTVAGLPLVEFGGIKRKILDAVEKITYGCAQWVLPNSRVQANYIVSEKYCRSEKVKVIGGGSSNGIDLQYFRNSETLDQTTIRLSEKMGISKTDFVLTFVGRLTNYKGVHELVRAFLSLKESISGLKLILVGPFEKLNPLDQDVYNAINMDPCIHATGHVDDVRPYLKMGDLFVFPSYREGFPQSLMQASAMGLPCVASNINGCNEIIDEGKNGILITPKSKAAIVTAIERLYADPQLRESMGLAGRKMMADGYDQQMIWAELLKFYKTHLK